MVVMKWHSKRFLQFPIFAQFSAASMPLPELFFKGYMLHGCEGAKSFT
jgi:hypothetical protein